MTKFNFAFLLIIFITCLSYYTNCTNTETETEQYRLVAPPSSGALFSSRCRYARVRGFTLFARCRDFYGNSRHAAINFSYCLKNYDGNLSRFTGALNELFTRRCFTNGTYLICSCQQPTGGFRRCSIRLNDVFTVKNGRLTC
jgi:hypothetical protein